MSFLQHSLLLWIDVIVVVVDGFKVAQTVCFSDEPFLRVVFEALCNLCVVLMNPLCESDFVMSSVVLIGRFAQKLVCYDVFFLRLFDPAE